MGRATEFFDYLNNDVIKPEFNIRYSRISFNGSRKDKMWIIATWNQARSVCVKCGDIVLKSDKSTVCRKCDTKGQWIIEKDLNEITG
jgi:ribosomal protein L40E